MQNFSLVETIKSFCTKKFSRRICFSQFNKNPPLKTYLAYSIFFFGYSEQRGICRNNHVECSLKKCLEKYNQNYLISFGNELLTGLFFATLLYLSIHKTVSSVHFSLEHVLITVSELKVRKQEQSNRVAWLQQWN